MLEPEIARNPSVRAEFEARLREAIAPGGPKGVVGDWFRDRALELATALMKPRRAQIMDLSTRFFGDIFLNLRHGDDIRQMIRDTINQASPPVLVMAHSLGGDIMFDLLTRADPPKVAMLVTVGSQVPFFYAMDGLHSIQPDYDNGKPKGASTKQAFEFPWINVYNVNDLLSFRASGVFQWPNLTEFHLESKVPFPMSHGTYFSDSKFYEFVKTLWNPMVQS